ncbi:EamA family transporter [Micrococcoides hystricis]|uniref:DMT family transporter n=1 Tax=Micrococcoides hystricis TaxID=1572761 RepID=A0ABV6PBN5_9MICC
MTTSTRASLPILVALISAATFALSGATASAIVASGWTSGAAVAARLSLSGLVLLLPAVLIARKQWPVVRANWKVIVAFGLAAMAGMQYFYFVAVSRLDVSVALLIEHMAPLLIVGWIWFRTGIAPRGLTIIGSLLALVGLALVIGVIENLLGEGIELDALGVIAALLSAVCLALYFAIGARDTGGLHPIVMTCGGMFVGSAAIGLLSLVGILPFAMTANPVEFTSKFGYAELPFWVPLVVLVLLATVTAYITGVYSARFLGSTLASFISLTEVMFATLWAWLFISQDLKPSQLFGGLFILGGIILIKLDHGRNQPSITHD